MWAHVEKSARRLAKRCSPDWNEAFSERSTTATPEFAILCTYEVSKLRSPLRGSWKLTDPQVGMKARANV